MSNSSSNATSPSTSSRPFGSSMVKSGSNRSLFQNSKKPVSRSRQNTIGYDFGEDLVRSNIGSDYQDIQIRTLTKWVNAQLQQGDESIDNIKTDLRDGKKLLKLLSVVSNEAAPKPERMNMRIHQLANVAQALSFLEKQVGSDAMPDIGNEAIVNGDAKKTLALIFFIMLKYQIQLIVSEHGDDYMQSLSDLSERENGTKAEFSVEVNKQATAAAAAAAPNTPLPLSSSRKFNSQNSITDKHTSSTAEAKVALLYWVRIQLEDYIAANLIPAIQDFSRSWRTGVAFCLLIHRHNPAYIPDLFNTHLSSSTDLSDKHTWHKLLRLAFDLATHQMGIQAYLEPEDLVDVEYPHEPSVMMYVSEYYKVMSKFQREEPTNAKRERAVKRKAAIVMASGGTTLTAAVVEESDELDTIPETEPLIPLAASDTPSSSQQQPEPPVPIPMPSARRKKKMAQRKSTLGKEDTARIKADLNSKLLMQLTGHLPHGVHPVLDQLLTIHETVLSFIKLNTRTIDEIPEEFVSSLAVSEYIDALEIIEEQADSEMEHLETAEKARDLLTAPPETADDTLIRLTDLQRTQVSKLYDILQKEWDQFIELLNTTKDDLLTVESALIDTEEGAEEYQARANVLDRDLAEFRQQLGQVSPTDDHSKLHPLEGSHDHAVAYAASLDAFCAKFSQYQSSVWKDFKVATRQLPRSVMQTVSARSRQIFGIYDALVIDVEKERQSLRNFERGLTVISTVQSMEGELETIEALMGDNNSPDKATTNDAIQLLESKVSVVRTTIFNTREEYRDLFVDDERLAGLFGGVESKYETVNAWVDQVRVWFIEAERIRAWIEERTRVIEQRNQEVQVDPLSEDFAASQWDAMTTEQLYEQHDKLRREIERFNQDDMTRLRSHVRVLTGATDRNLTPADASTIEITLTTLTILDRMMHMLRTRSKLVDTLKVRIEWDTLMDKAVEWCEAKAQEIQTFVAGKARWSADKDDDVEEMSTHQLKLLTEEVIQILVSLENSIAEFDKGDFSLVLDIYQEMEELQSPLPQHLEARQDAFERQFELVMKQCAFARKVVEQYLVVSDIAAQFKKLRVEGEKLKRAMSQSSSTSTSANHAGGGGGDSNNYHERVQVFKDSSSNWVTVLMKRAPYPELPDMLEDKDGSNQDANQAIRNRLNEYATCLAEITEDLQELLASHRENLSLQQRTSLAYDDMFRITTWLEDRLRAVQKFDASVVDQEDVIELETETTIERLEKEQESIASKLAHLEAHEMHRVLDAVRLLEVEIDSVNSVTIDRQTLVNGIENLEQGHADLKEALESRKQETNVLRKRIVWEAQWDEAHRTIQQLAHTLWDFDNRFAQYDAEGLKKRRSDLEAALSSQEIQVNKQDLHVQILDQLETAKSSLLIIASDDAFNQLQDAYSAYDVNEQDATPAFILQKQNDIKSDYYHLQRLSNYVSDVLKQHDAIADFVAQSQQLQAQGETAKEAIQNSLRATTSSTKLNASASTSTSTSTTTATATTTAAAEEQKQLQEKITSTKAQIQQLVEQGKSIQPLEGGDWFESLQPQTLVSTADYNAQITVLMNKHMDALTKLDDSLAAIMSSYKYVDSIKSKLLKYQAEASEMQDWIDQLTKKLNRNHIDITAVSSNLSLDMIAMFKSEHARLAAELSDFESTRVSGFQERLEELTKQVSGGDASSSAVDGTAETCRHLGECVARSMLLLGQSFATQLLMLETGEKRLQWEANMDTSLGCLDSLNQQLQEYVSKKNKCVAQQDTLSKETIQDLLDHRSDLSQQAERFEKDTLRAMESEFEQVKALFVKLPLTKSIPIHIQEKMDMMDRVYRKLQDALVWRAKELEYIQQRTDLEISIKQAIVQLDEQRKDLASFVQERGRWNPDLLSEQDSIESEWQTKRASFDVYRSSVLSDIKQQYQSLQSISDALKPGFMSELHAKRIELMSQAEGCVDADIVYAQELLTQKKQINHFLQQSAVLETDAEAIRELFLTSSADALVPTSSCSELTKRLEDFGARVDKAKTFASHDILVPKRSNQDDLSMPTKVRDKTMNSVVQDMIATKVSRLDDLVRSLSALLKSQEVFTRLSYILDTFKRQIDVCSAWISSRRDILEKSVHMLDDESLSMDIEHLRDAVSEAESIQTAMRAQDNNFTLLCNYREKYMLLFDEQGLLSDQEKQDKLQEYDSVCENFDAISHEWNDLLLETRDVSNALSMALLPAELNSRIALLMASFAALESDISATEAAHVTDQQISGWQKRIDFLESKEYDRLHAEIAEYKHTITADMIESLMAKLDVAGDTVLTIRASLTSLYDMINASRLRNTHAENSTLFHSAAERVATLIAQVQHGKFSTTTDKQTADERLDHFKELKAAHKQIKEAVLECQGFYDDSCSYYTGMRVQGVVTPESQQVQQDVDVAWQALQAKNSGLAAFVTRTSKWIEGCDELDKLEASLRRLKDDMDKILLVHQPSSTTKTKLLKYEKKLAALSMSQQELESTVKNSTDLSDDEANKAGFLKRSQAVRELKNDIQKMLDKRRLDKERLTLFDMFKNEVAKVSRTCEDQIAYIRQQANANPEHQLKKIDSINNIITAYSAALSHIQDTYSECKIKCDGIVSDQATKLVKTYEHPAAQVDECKAGLEKLLQELKAALKTENDYVTSLKLLSRLTKFEREISRSVTELKGTVSRSYNGSSSKASTRAARTRDLPELREFMQRYESVEASIQEFLQKCTDLEKNLNRRISPTRTAAITKAVDRRRDDTNRKWADIKASADDTRDRLDMLQKRQAVSSKLAESLKYVDDLKDRVEALQLSGKNVSVEEQELDEIQEEIDVTLNRASSEIDNLMKSISRSEVVVSGPSPGTLSLKQQREKLVKSVEDLRQLVKHRRKQAHTEGSITEFFGITDQIDAEIAHLAQVVQETSAQHASVVGSKFNKADLQALLKRLVATYKKSEPRISDLLVKVKSESQKQFLDDNERVAKRLEKTKRDWADMQASVSSREKELQTCIKELNHEFFTKLAMAKSTPKERRSRRGSNGRSRNGPQSPASTAPRPVVSFRSSTLSTEMKMTSPSHTATRRSSKTPSSPSNSSKNYVSDPKNELDVQLGLIVNESPYKMKVKMVPGEVGKYWFGDEHPRLVYCRILPSKMVMVRVGGGWEELSRYMKDHGHSDGLATKSETGETQYITVNTFKDAVDDAPSFSVTTRSGSPMGPVVGTPIIRRGSGVSSSLTNRSSNSSSGYVDGDKFIQTDQDGNQIALKMVKADISATTSNTTTTTTTAGSASKR
ncbi:hypothetical protein [Parasitella parasitica]|uniref:Calponin-homology (CH) domain-containing protein n=1 Tax=Parasitella parasitica TaxID=35722 RepID=A0A0B7MV38_9FUNG|nr:hypothetical protein [Parasitella parasitica]